MKLFVSISGSKFRDPSICEVAYKDTVNVKSVHFIGAKDWLRLPSEELATAFYNPLIIRHPQAHTVPRLGTVYIFSCYYILCSFILPLLVCTCKITRYWLFILITADEAATEQLRGWTLEILRCNNRGLNNNFDEMKNGLVQKEPRTEKDSKEEVINDNAGKMEVEVLDAAKSWQ